MKKQRAEQGDTKGEMKMEARITKREIDTAVSARREMAHQDIALAEKEGSLLIGHTRLGLIELLHKDGMFSIAGVFSGDRVEATAALMPLYTQV